jgi:hypothetical protein
MKTATKNITMRRETILRKQVSKNQNAFNIKFKELDTSGVCKIHLTTNSIHVMDQENTNFNRRYRVNFWKKLI